MALTTAEQEALRFHLGYGNLAISSLPYTGDGFWTQVGVVSATLGTGTETSATTVITAGSTTTVTPVSMTGIVVYGQLVVGVGDEAEVVIVTAAAVSTFTAYFAKAHAATGYPIATMSGLARLRLLLWDADKAWRECTSASTSAVNGIKSVDKGDAVWFEGFSMSRAKRDYYLGIANQISNLTRIRNNWPSGHRCTRIEC